MGVLVIAWYPDADAETDPATLFGAEPVDWSAAAIGSEMLDAAASPLEVFADVAAQLGAHTAYHYMTPDGPCGCTATAAEPAEPTEGQAP